ncbi:hypothetical protein BS50DRAFT_303567 [Corynespora cassiicola Philippines]|uniref:Uncharacterized protein n=1 Tax=Corynespora cassiicola Philippines TaxID=1448308 RepID=A0A2T2NXB1_CORCC|nr:hypothetical protein BS50DRAFT_303567 [Corynespora cassiicola Philippines]
MQPVRALLAARCSLPVLPRLPCIAEVGIPHALDTPPSVLDGYLDYSRPTVILTLRLTPPRPRIALAESINGTLGGASAEKRLISHLHRLQTHRHAPALKLHNAALYPRPVRTKRRPRTGEGRGSVGDGAFSVGGWGARMGSGALICGWEGRAAEDGCGAVRAGGWLWGVTFVSAALAACQHCGNCMRRLS